MENSINTNNMINEKVQESQDSLRGNIEELKTILAELECYEKAEGIPARLILHLKEKGNYIQNIARNLADEKKHETETMLNNI